MTNLSTFGLVLEWVSQRLKKVEKDMEQDLQHNAVIKHSVTGTYQFIDNLAQHDQELAKNFDNAVIDAEYKALVDIIQRHRTTLTPESMNDTINTLREFRISEEEIRQIEARMQKTLNSP